MRERLQPVPPKPPRPPSPLAFRDLHRDTSPAATDFLDVKEGDHAYLFKQVQAAEEAGCVTYYERHVRAAGLVHRFRFVNDMPLNGSRADVRVNFIEYWEIGQDKEQHFSWVTDLRVS